MSSRYDVVVVGAGILGLASAYHLLKNRPDLNLLIIDRMLDAGQGNTARSAAQFRDVFSSEINYALASSSVDFYLHLQKQAGYDLGIRMFGYLWLLSEKSMKKLAPVAAKVRQRGVDVSMLSLEEASRIPGLVTDVEKDPEAQLMGLQNLAGGFFGRKCGGLSAEKLVGYYKRELMKMKAKIAFGTEVNRLIVEPTKKFGWPGEPYLWQESGIVGLDVKGQMTGEVRADLIVNASGAWTNDLLDPIGIDSRVEQQKREMFVLSTKSPERATLKSLLYTKGFNEEDTLPYIRLEAGPGGIAITPHVEEETFWIRGHSRWTRSFVHSIQPDLEQYPVNQRTYDESVFRAVTKYLPQFSSARYNTSKGDTKWPGFYTVNSADGTPYIFHDHGLIVVTGCSGSGVLKADAIGRVVDGLAREKATVDLFNGARIEVSDLGIEKRRVEPEQFVF